MYRTSNSHTHNLFKTPLPLMPVSAGFAIATRLPLDCHSIASRSPLVNVHTNRMSVKQCLAVRKPCVPWVGDFTSCWESIEAIVRQSSGSRVAIEWQSSGNRKTCTRGHKVEGCPRYIESMTIKSRNPRKQKNFREQGAIRNLSSKGQVLPWHAGRMLGFRVRTTAG